MAGLNKVMVIGNVGRAPETKYTESTNKRMVTFSVAVNRVTGSGEERKTDTTWLNVIAWDKTAELCERLVRKGALLYVEGRLQMRDFTDKKCTVGCKRTAVEIVLENFQLLERKEGGEANEPAAARPSALTDASADDGDAEIPF